MFLLKINNKFYKEFLYKIKSCNYQIKVEKYLFYQQYKLDLLKNRTSHYIIIKNTKKPKKY